MNVNIQLANPANYVEGLRRLFPGIQLDRDVRIVNNMDGNGAILVEWNLPAAPPTDADIANALSGPRPDADVTNAVNPVVLKVLFFHENRLRALEAKAALTVAQFIAAIKTLL